MQLTRITLLSISSLAFADYGRDNNHPGGAAGIENAVTSLLSQTHLPPDIATLGPALSSAGVTGVVVSDSTLGTSQPTGTSNSGSSQDSGNGYSSGSDDSNNNGEQGSSGSNNDDENQNNDNNNENEGSRHRGSAASCAVPQVFIAGAAGAVGMAVLGVL